MEQVKLPTKTKIAAWWMIILGGLVIIFIIADLVKAILIVTGMLGFLLIPTLLGLFLLISSTLLFRRKKSGWIIAIITFSIILLPLPLAFLTFLFPDSIFGNLFYLIGTKENAPLSGFFYLFVGSFLKLLPLLGIMGFLIPIAIVLIPFIFLLLDRKNFWRIAT